MPASGPPDLSNSPLELNADRYTPRLLLWVWQKGAGRANVRVSCEEFGSSQGIPMTAVKSVVDGLRAQKLLQAHGPDPRAVGGDVPVVSLTESGAAHATSLQQQRDDPAERGRHTLNALPHWIYAHADRRPLRIDAFFDSPNAFYLGKRLTRDEVGLCLRYLTEYGLITSEGPLFRNHPGVGSHVALTREGLDAVLSRSDIDRFVERQRELAKPEVTEHIEVKDSNLWYTKGVSHSTVQTGFTPAEVVWLLAQFAAVLDLDEASRAELRRSAEQLAPGEGADNRSDQKRGLMERIQRQLGTSPDTMGRQLLLNTVGQAMEKLLGG